MLSPIKLKNTQQQRENDDMLNDYYKMMKKCKELETELEIERTAHQNSRRKMQVTIMVQQQEI